MGEKKSFSIKIKANCQIKLQKLYNSYFVNIYYLVKRKIKSGKTSKVKKNFFIIIYGLIYLLVNTVYIIVLF